MMRSAQSGAGEARPVGPLPQAPDAAAQSRPQRLGGGRGPTDGAAPTREGTRTWDGLLADRKVGRTVAGPAAGGRGGRRLAAEGLAVAGQEAQAVGTAAAGGGQGALDGGEIATGAAFVGPAQRDDPFDAGQERRRRRAGGHLHGQGVGGGAAVEVAGGFVEAVQQAARLAQQPPAAG